MPDVAIGTEQVRKFVLVVDGENVARPKYVTLGPVMDGLRVVTAGLEPDDRVIVNGLMRARPGVKVTPQEVAGSADGSACRQQHPDHGQLRPGARPCASPASSSTGRSSPASCRWCS